MSYPFQKLVTNLFESDRCEKGLFFKRISIFQLFTVILSIFQIIHKHCNSMKTR